MESGDYLIEMNDLFLNLEIQMYRTIRRRSLREPVRHPCRPVHEGDEDALIRYNMFTTLIGVDATTSLVML